MKFPNSSFKRIQGLSLVELMVAITIGLIIMAAVSSLFVSSKQTYTTQDSLARLQENGRLAMQFLIKDIRLAGFFGCLDGVDPGPTAQSDGSVASSNTKYLVNGGPTFTANPFVRIEGIENASTSTTWLPSIAAQPANIKPGTDAITIRMANVTAAANVAPGMLNGASPLIVNDTTPFTTGDIVVVSDCITADVIKITNITGSPADTLERAISQNVTTTLSKPYEPQARVHKLTLSQYFIQTKPDGVPALFRDGVELVEGIENLQILYGEDTDVPPDGLPNIYRRASAVADWSRVMSVRIGVLARTINSEGTDLDQADHDVDDDGIPELSAAGDRFRRRVFQAVVKLRNI